MPMDCSRGNQFYAAVKSKAHTSSDEFFRSNTNFLCYKQLLPRDLDDGGKRRVGKVGKCGIFPQKPSGANLGMNAKEECLADAEVRERRRAREAERREALNQQYVAGFARRILENFPKCPTATAEKIAQHACKKYSGRVGRSAPAKEFDSQAILLAVRAHVRHQYTNYDELLFKGYDRHDARALVEEKVDSILDEWMKKN